jgi:DNA invertase Pin-like site-specific DNA recombinase
MKAVAPGDVVTVTRIDRPARSTFDLLAIVKRIVDAGAQFRSLTTKSKTCSGASKTGGASISDTTVAPTPTSRKSA